MNLDNRTIYHRHLHIGLIGQVIEHALEYTGTRPIPEPAIDCVPVPEPRRQVAPRRPSARNPEDRFHEQASVAAGQGKRMNAVSHYVLGKRGEI